LAELHAQTRRARRAGAQDRFQPVVENHRRSRRRRAGAGQTGTGQTGTGGGQSRQALLSGRGILLHGLST
jgi:hypothetical protein